MENPRNHGMVREAIEESGIQRDELFLTSKVGFFPSSMDLPQDSHGGVKTCSDVYSILQPRHEKANPKAMLPHLMCI